MSCILGWLLVYKQSATYLIRLPSKPGRLNCAICQWNDLSDAMIINLEWIRQVSYIGSMKDNKVGCWFRQVTLLKQVSC